MYAITGKNPQQRWFCSACGSTLYWKASFQPDATGIAGGCFADDPLDAPSMTVSNDGRCAWVGLPAAWRVSLS